MSATTPPGTCHDQDMGAAISPFIGRASDLLSVADAAMTARDGSTRAVLITGEAGIGKSRLVAEAVAAIDDALVITGRAAEMSTGEIAFGVLADTLRDVVRVAGPEVLTPAEREALAPLLPGAAADQRTERVRLLSSYLDLLARLASERFLVWVVEDLHWADSATRDAVNLALRTMRGSFLLIATVRTDDPSRSREVDADLTAYVAALARIPDTTVIPLGRLTQDEVRAQVIGLLGSQAQAATTERIATFSDGIPFVVEELAAVAGQPALATSASVADGRLAGLSPESRRLVDAAAVGDGHLRISLLEHVVDATSDELDESLDEAVRRGVLVADPMSDAIEFRHALLRDAVDRAMGPGARRSWHRRWAEVLETNPGVLAVDPCALAVAEHWHQARDERRAFTAAVAALPAVGRLFLPDEAAELWTRVLPAYARIEDAAEISGLSFREAYALAVLDSLPASHHVSRALLDAVPVSLMSPAEELMHDLLAERAGKGEANTLDDGRLLAICDAFDSEPKDRLTIHAWCQVGSRLTDHPDRGEQLLQQARTAAAELGDPRIRVLVEMADSYRSQANGDPEGSAARVREAIRRESANEVFDGLVGLRGNLVWDEVICGRHKQAQEASRDAFALLTHPHLRVQLWEHLIENTTASFLMTGQWAEAREMLEASTPWWEDSQRTSNARLELLNILQHGRADDTERWRRQLESPADGGASMPDARLVLAWAALARGDLAAMRTELTPAWALERPALYDDQLWQLALVGARAEADLAATTGSHDVAGLEHIEALSATAERCRRYGPLGEVWPVDLAAQVERFHGRDARPLLAQALAGWESIGHVPDVAITHLSLAEAHAVHGDREAAVQHLRTGREIAERLEAQPMLARADALAERFALTARERRTSDTLTEREAEVLALLAEGRTNAEIGDVLFMSPKTASVHVSHIIAKLGAANRTEAAAIGRRHGLID